MAVSGALLVLTMLIDVSDCIFITSALRERDRKGLKWAPMQALEISFGPPRAPPAVEIAYCNRIGCSCPKVLTVDETDVSGTVPRK